MAGRYRRNGEAETLGCLVQLLLLLVAMPLFFRYNKYGVAGRV